MKSTKRGKNISSLEVTNISSHGFWILVVRREYFVDFEGHPWFREATVAQILDVRLEHGHHLHWPGLDVDLDVEGLEKPEKYTLVYK